MSVDSQPRWQLTVYVSGASPNSAAPPAARRCLCDEEFAGQADLQVVGVLEQPALGVRDGIVAIPTLVPRLPGPLPALVGDRRGNSPVRVSFDLAAVNDDQGGQQTP